MTNVVEVRIEPAAHTGLAEDKDAARAIRRLQILPALSKGDRIVLDFASVQFTTQSFIHALIASAIQERGKEVLAQIEFRGCNDNVRSVILTVVNYTLRAEQLSGGGGPATAVQ